VPSDLRADLVTRALAAAGPAAPAALRDLVD
jgi:hypothetical protein